MKENRQSKGTFFRNALDFESERLEPCPDGFHEKDIVLLGRLDEGA